MRSEEEE